MNSTINNQPSTAFPHEKLEVWQVAKSLAKRVYEITARFPKEVHFGLVDQMRRAGVSVMPNLAESDYQEVRQPVMELVKRISALRSSQLKRAEQ